MADETIIREKTAPAGSAPRIRAESAVTDLEEFLTSFSDAMAFGDEDPAAVVDRHYPSGIEQRSDGVTFDRERLIEHARPLRKNTVAASFEVHEAIVEGRRIAARYTLTAETRHGGATDTEIYMFGELDPSGRPRRIDQITRRT